MYPLRLSEIFSALRTSFPRVQDYHYTWLNFLAIKIVDGKFWIFYLKRPLRPKARRCELYPVSRGGWMGGLDSCLLFPISDVTVLQPGGFGMASYVKR